MSLYNDIILQVLLYELINQVKLKYIAVYSSFEYVVVVSEIPLKGAADTPLNKIVYQQKYIG